VHCAMNSKSNVKYRLNTKLVKILQTQKDVQSKDIATRFHLGESQVSRHIQGNGTQIKVLEAIAEALETPLEDLIEKPGTGVLEVILVFKKNGGRARAEEGAAA